MLTHDQIVKRARAHAAEDVALLKYYFEASDEMWDAVQRTSELAFSAGALAAQRAEVTAAQAAVKAAKEAK
jgi:plasmid maintenance system antidote protein VapI